MKRLLVILALAAQCFPQTPVTLPPAQYAGISGGTAQAQTVTISPAIPALNAGLTFSFKPGNANTGAAPTIAVNSLTAKSVTKCGTTALVASDLTTTAIAEVKYDGTEFQLLNPQAAGCGGSGGGSVTSVVIAGTANEITATGTCTITTSGTCTLSVPNPFLAVGILDGRAPSGPITSCPFNFGSVYQSGYTDIEDTALTTPCIGTLPVAVAGLQYCVDNSNVSGSPVTGTITIQTSGSGQYIVDATGARSASGGYVISGGAGGDAACVRGIDSTRWRLYVGVGTWTTH